MAATFQYEDLRLRDGVILYILSTTGIIANMFAILASARLLRIQPLSPNVFVLGLSCADLVSITLLSFPSWLCYINGEWIGGKRLCDFQGFAFLFSTLCSAFMAALMAVDRCVAVTQPFFHRKTMTANKAKVLLLVATAASLFASFLPVFRFGSFVKNISGSFCSVNWFPQTKSDSVFCVFYAVLGGLPAIVVVLCNVTVIIELFRSRQRRISVTNTIVSGAASLSRQLHSRNTDREETEKQFSKTMVVISVVYLSSWIPFTVRLVGNAFYNWRNSSADLLVCSILLLNLIVDPFLYVLTRKQYRKVLKALFSCRCSKRNRVRPFRSHYLSISSASLYYSCNDQQLQLKDLKEILHCRTLQSQRDLEDKEQRLNNSNHTNHGTL